MVESRCAIIRTVLPGLELGTERKREKEKKGGKRRKEGEGGEGRRGGGGVETNATSIKAINSQ